MADWGQRAKDKDRDDAIRVIEDAAARGRIIDADKDKRIQEVRAAGTVGEIELITRGLAAAPAVAADVSADPPPATTFPQYTPPTTPPVAEPDPLPPSTVQYGEPLTPSAGTPVSTPPVVTRNGARNKLVLILVLCLMAGIALPIFFGIRSLIDSVDDLPGISGGGADVYSDEGFEDMVREVEDGTGSTEVWEFSLFDDYAIVYVPTQPTGKRYIAYRYDGALTEFTKGSQSLGEQRFDLTDVDAGVLRKLRSDAEKLVENPTNSYVIVRPPPLGEGPVQVSAHASNEFNESGHLVATLNGKIISEHPPS